MALCCTITFEEKGSFCEVVCLLAAWHVLLFLLDNEQGHDSVQSKEVTWCFTPSHPLRLYQGELCSETLGKVSH